MSGYSASNPRELKDIILRRLGAPINNVELTESQIYDCISRAIELFTEYHPDGLNRTFVTVQLTEEQAKTGIIQFDKPIYAVTKILRAGSTFWTMDGNTTFSWFSDFLRGLAGAGTPGSCNTYAPGMFSGGGDLQTYSMLMSYKNTMMDQLSPLNDFWYNSMTRTMRVVGNLKAGDLIVFECWVQTAMMVADSATGIIGNERNLIGSTATNDPNELWDDPYTQLQKNNFIGNAEMYAEQGVYNVRWVKDYSTSLAKELNGIVLRKFQGAQLPGGVTIDGQTIIQEAKDEIAALRDELMSISEPLPIMIG
ncbi:head-tail adaptor Ad2 [Vibrio phage EniLVp02]